MLLTACDVVGGANDSCCCDDDDDDDDDPCGCDDDDVDDDDGSWELGDFEICGNVLGGCGVVDFVVVGVGNDDDDATDDEDEGWGLIDLRVCGCDNVLGGVRGAYFCLREWWGRVMRLQLWTLGWKKWNHSFQKDIEVCDKSVNLMILVVWMKAVQTHLPFRKYFDTFTLFILPGNVNGRLKVQTFIWVFLHSFDRSRTNVLVPERSIQNMFSEQKFAKETDLLKMWRDWDHQNIKDRRNEMEICVSSKVIQIKWKWK